MNIPTQIDFDGKVALITGAAGGIGKATARRFAELGASVMLADLDEDALRDITDAWTKEGFDVKMRTCDVSNETQFERLVEQTEDKFGRLDFLFNNAGIEGPRQNMTDYDTETFDKVIGVNMRGVFFGLKHAIASMLKTGGGAVINTSSIAGKSGFEGLAPYVASKHAVIGLTRTAALEYADKNIRVNAICPGVIHTEMVERDSGGDLEPMKEMEPVKRLGQPEEIAALVTFLCSDQAKFITGTAVDIDGGLLAG